MEKFSMESGADQLPADSQLERHIQEEVDDILNDQELLARQNSEIWKGALNALDDLIDLVLARVNIKLEMDKDDSTRKIDKFQNDHLRERVKRIITQHKDVNLKEDASALSLKIGKKFVLFSNLDLLRKHGVYPKK